MSRRSRFVCFLLTLAVVFVTHVGSARAGSATADSDRMVVTDPTSGATLFDMSIPQPPVGAPETSLTFGAPPPIPPVAGEAVVFLTEPSFEPVDPAEPPPITLPGTNLVVSDAVLATPNGVTLISDGDPLLAQIVASLPPGSVSVEETGTLQDLTSSLRILTQFGVQVQSDVVPEPATFGLLGLGLLGLAAQGRRRRPMGGSR